MTAPLDIDAIAALKRTTIFGVDFILVAPEQRDALVARVRAAEAENERTCQWKYADWPCGADYDTACGMTWCFNAGDIAENSVTYCPKCGGKVIVPTRRYSCVECGDDVDGPNTTCEPCQQEIEEENAALTPPTPEPTR